ncbi:KUP/HAK/KT family potassium transporter [Cupriavidus sp. amp6]|uniref:KUP/HAK/KT family potassium transporter n=1 Tax=Cupriavidus sp. amp6 TaxID=388051 RepID=UPI002101579F|nr:KUP/HAK/KT family potassium transporter [Cupriavidus sp. amp6]
MPVSVGVLIALCLVLRHSTAMIWAFFGPIMLLWFLALARSSIQGIIRCAAQSPIVRRGRSGCLPADGNHVWFAVNMLDTR